LLRQKEQYKFQYHGSSGGALYEVLVLADGKVEIEDLKSKLSKFLENKEIFTEKESKGKIKSVDIRPMIYNVAVTTVKNTEAGVLESTKTDFTEDGCKICGF